VTTSVTSARHVAIQNGHMVCLLCGKAMSHLRIATLNVSAVDNGPPLSIRRAAMFSRFAE
jgi:hypothetical protein